MGGEFLEKWLLISQIAEQLDIPENTARRHAKNFKEYLPSKTTGRVTRYSPEACGILARISELYNSGLTTQEVYDHIQGTCSREITVQQEQGGQLVDPYAELIGVMKELTEEIRGLKSRLDTLEAPRSDEKEPVKGNVWVGTWERIQRLFRGE